MYEFVFDQAWDYPLTTDQWIKTGQNAEGEIKDRHILKAWDSLHKKYIKSMQQQGKPF
ncbi:hypothetical protein [Bacteroides thetaiotaomicron]|uniref:hypothetical protein n=1 Tax=Bacteroides thetaiotaomicron TaxID=818 RepID=UPI002165F034|nr:hypothetical protein [Bacteroides thetaiotaomicron]MCS3044303.1 hypothetical protein [Bacteroides thetaiotaomicron]